MKPVSQTAYYCCGVRMQDALSAKPLLNDHYARMLMGDDGMRYWERFKKYDTPNASNIARCYLIDTWVKRQLQRDTNTTVILIGAGLDSRAFRLAGGNWIELDEPAIIAYKNALLPAGQCTNPLQRIPVDFETETLAGKLQPFTGLSPVVFIVEGVLMYLTNEQKQELFTTLTSLFNNHLLLCDLMNAVFFNRLGKKGIHRELSVSGANFRDLQEKPEQLLLDAGYMLEEKFSNVITASDHGLVRIPRLIIKYLMKNLLMGYASYQFRFNAATGTY